jgi:hypothetical protein
MSAESSKRRFARFKARPDVADVASRYGDWAVSSEGVGINLDLALFAMQRVCGQLPRPAYRLAVRDLAATTTIPLRDFLILAKCQLELLRSGLAGLGQITFTPTEWDAEGGAD